ncbi:MAG: hypothetical protein GX947_07155 [Tissierellia bacterium]|nr:hypothetical protein [Tissierellia bacterium]
MENLTIDKIALQLLDGLDKSKFNEVKQWLIEYQITNKLTLKQLNELCWNDSNWIFDQIF